MAQATLLTKNDEGEYIVHKNCHKILSLSVHLMTNCFLFIVFTHLCLSFFRYSSIIIAKTIKSRVFIFSITVLLNLYSSDITPMTRSEIELKLKTYEDYLEDRLKYDLKCIEDHLRQKSEIYQEWLEIKNVGKYWKYLQKKNCDANVQVEIGNGVNTFAKVKEFDRLLVDIGAGVLLEMDCEEACKYATIRMNVLRKEITHLRRMAVNVKVHIKLVLLAMYELQKV